MKPKEKEFCRLMTIYADPCRAAREAGYRHPKKAMTTLLGREDIAAEIQRRGENARAVYRSAAVSGLYRLACGDVGDAMLLLQHEDMSAEALRELDLMSVSEVKRSDRGVEIKFADRVKAMDKLLEMLGNEMGHTASEGLLNAMLLSAEALGKTAEQVKACDV